MYKTTYIGQSFGGLMVRFHHGSAKAEDKLGWNEKTSHLKFQAPGRRAKQQWCEYLNSQVWVQWFTPQTRSHISKQLHQLETKNSNIWAYREHSKSIYHIYLLFHVHYKAIFFWYSFWDRKSWLIFPSFHKNKKCCNFSHLDLFLTLSNTNLFPKCKCIFYYL